MQSPPSTGSPSAAPPLPTPAVAPSTSQPSLGALARDCFDTFVRELRNHGLDVDPALHLVVGEGMLSAYDLNAHQIRLSLPDLATPMGRLQAMVLGTYLGCDDERQVELFFRAFVPRLVAHELGHSLRHRYGRFGADLWLEEQMANRLAVALTQRRMSHHEREAARVILRRALDTLSAHASTPGAAALTYEDVLRGLNASGMLDDASHRNLEVTRQVLSIGRRQALRSSTQPARRPSPSSSRCWPHPAPPRTSRTPAPRAFSQPFQASRTEGSGPQTASNSLRFFGKSSIRRQANSGLCDV